MLGAKVRDSNRYPCQWVGKDVKAATWDRVQKKIVTRLESKPVVWPLYLWGDAGGGKSCLAHLLWRNYGGYWLDASKAIRAITEAWGAGVSVFLGIPDWPYKPASYQLERLASQGFCVIDDLGVRKPTDSQHEAAYEIAKARMDKPTVVTCNLNPEQLASVYDDRLVSRLTCGTVLNLAGKDRRILDVEES